MPIAALPKYLAEKNLMEASPGLQFYPYLAVWTTERDQKNELRKRAKKRSQEAQEVRDLIEMHGEDGTINILIQAQKNPIEKLWHKQKSTKRLEIKLPDTSRKLIQGWRDRLHAVALAEQHTVLFPAQATAPFVIGMGNEHPLENGFSFLWPYGVPYLPGSSVKGVIRQAFRELDIDEAATTALLGLESERGSQDHQRGALIFHDVIPEIAGGSLKVEIMNPHFNDYYQKGKTPHENDNPVPIYFLAVPEGSRFDFMVSCDEAFLQRLNSDLVKQDESGQPRWQVLLQQAFEYAFDWLGFGAKTRVGYGAMQVDEQAMADLEYEKKEAEKAAQLTEEQQLIVELKEKLEKYPADTFKPGAENFEPLRQAFEQAESWNEANLTEFVQDIFIPWWKSVSPSKSWQKKNSDKFSVCSIKERN